MDTLWRSVIRALADREVEARLPETATLIGFIFLLAAFLAALLFPVAGRIVARMIAGLADPVADKMSDDRADRFLTGRNNLIRFILRLTGNLDTAMDAEESKEGARWKTKLHRKFIFLRRLVFIIFIIALIINCIWSASRIRAVVAGLQDAVLRESSERNLHSDLGHEAAHFLGQVRMDAVLTRRISTGEIGAGVVDWLQDDWIFCTEPGHEVQVPRDDLLLLQPNALTDLERPTIQPVAEEAVTTLLQTLKEAYEHGASPGAVYEVPPFFQKLPDYRLDLDALGFASPASLDVPTIRETKGAVFQSSVRAMLEEVSRKNFKPFFPKLSALAEGPFSLEVIFDSAHPERETITGPTTDFRINVTAKLGALTFKGVCHVSLGSYNGKAFVLKERWTLSYDSNEIDARYAGMKASLKDFPGDIQTYLNGQDGLLDPGCEWSPPVQYTLEDLATARKADPKIDYSVADWIPGLITPLDPERFRVRARLVLTRKREEELGVSPISERLQYTGIFIFRVQDESIVLLNVKEADLKVTNEAAPQTLALPPSNELQPP